jgi:hypothetical protein
VKLREYIELLGDEVFANKMSTQGHLISARAAQSWRLGQRQPKFKTAAHISKQTKGKVSIEECMNG